MPLLNPQRHVVPIAVLTQSKLVPITAARPVTTVVPKTNVTRPRQAKTVVTKPHSPPRRHINCHPSPKVSNFFLKVTAAKAPMVNAAKGGQRKWEWKPKCPILDHVSRTTSASITLKGLITMIHLGDPRVIDSGCSRHMTGNMSYLSDFEELIGGYIAFDGNPKGGKISGKENEPEFEGMKHEYEVYVSPSRSAQTKKHDDKTKREAKGKSLVESLTRYRNLSAEFEDFFDNSINEVNAAGNSVPTVGQIFTDSTNTFSVVDMLELEDIAYSDDEEDVGAEADLTNLETPITVSPIPTTRAHKDHHVTQIIGNLSSATQTKSMTRVAKDQDRLSQINNDDFHTCMFACFLSQEEPKRVHQALKDPSWIKAMQQELLQFKMQKVWVLVDLPKGKRATCQELEAVRIMWSANHYIYYNIVDFVGREEISAYNVHSESDA
nr:hypothetical protein [Tanacetum cinerariifolium]